MYIELMKRSRRILSGLAAFAAVLLIAGAALAEGDAAADTVETEVYPLGICIVSGGKLGSMGDPVAYEYEGREIRFCCKGCVAQFEKNPAAYLEKLDEAIIAAQVEDYPLETCPVSGMKLGSMGDPVDHVYDNRLVRFCCAGCIPEFKKDPETYMEKLDAAGRDPVDETSKP